MATLRSRRFYKEINAGDLTASSNIFYDFSTERLTADEVPFNNIMIRNFSAQRIRVTYNDTIAIIGANEVYSDDSAYGLRNLLIENTSTTDANSDLIFIQFSRVVSGDAALIADITGENMFDVANGVV